MQFRIVTSAVKETEQDKGIENDGTYVRGTDRQTETERGWEAKGCWGHKVLQEPAMLVLIPHIIC